MLHGDAIRGARRLRHSRSRATAPGRSRTTKQASSCLSRFEFDGFVKSRNIYDHAYDIDDFEQDIETLKQLEAGGHMRRS